MIRHETFFTPSSYVGERPLTDDDTARAVDALIERVGRCNVVGIAAWPSQCVTVWYQEHEARRESVDLWWKVW